MSTRLETFVKDFAALVERAHADEETILREGGALLKGLVSRDDWLAADCSQAPAGKYCQYLLHCDPRQRFSVVSFAWGPGARTPIHDHTVWGIIGVLRGAEVCHEYGVPQPGQPMRERASHRMAPGQIDKVSPRIGDIHVVENGLPDGSSVSIHVYGGDIGRIERHTYDAADGSPRRFVSGYTNA